MAYTSSTIGRLLGDLEREIMRVVWKHHEGMVTIQEVIDGLATRGLAYTTVMTIMNRLTEKGILVRDNRHEPHRYAARHSEQEFFRSVAGTMFDRIQKEFGSLAIASFVEEAEKVSRKGLRKLRKLQKKI
ncbi:MAG: BlaI/MecI/CopY family transcriptional regulator [Candidatus Magasanikbacteria bacterium]|nr:BlaI/MecI/CopY family transcriptional regulator [Candidatus Magasanikbacteria bacterium]